MILPIRPRQGKSHPSLTTPDETLAALAARHLATEQELVRLERAAERVQRELLQAERQSRYYTAAVAQARLAQVEAYRQYRRALRETLPARKDPSS